MALAIAGLAVFASRFFGGGEILFYVTTLFIAFILAVFMVTRKGLMMSLLKPLSRKFMPMKYQKISNKLFHDFYQGIALMSKGRIAAAVILSTLSWIIATLLYYFFADVSFDFTYFLL